jgi:hypothetical protein
MAFNVSNFRAELQGDGARPNLFTVEMSFPTYLNVAAANQKLTFMCKTAALPGSTIGQVPVFYFGRETKLAGNRTFPEWNITVINDEDFKVRNAFEKWITSMGHNQDGQRDLIAKNSAGYTTQALVRQYSKTGENDLKSYVFHGLFPIDVSQIDLDWGSNDVIEEFSVTLSYQYFTSLAKDGTVIQ